MPRDPFPGNSQRQKNAQPLNLANQRRLCHTAGQNLTRIHLNITIMTSPSLSRFAPSPTGRLHCGHACSALHAQQLATETGGQFILRIEDIDFTRCREEFTTGIFEDLAWLGFHWPVPVRCQSQHLQDYRGLAENLLQRGLLYPCFCTRQEIQREIAAAGGAPHGSEGPLYPGTCRRLSADERQFRILRGDQFALRLNLNAALTAVSQPLEWIDLIRGPQLATPELSVMSFSSAATSAAVIICASSMTMHFRVLHTFLEDSICSKPPTCIGCSRNFCNCLYPSIDTTRCCWMPREEDWQNAIKLRLSGPCENRG